MKEGQKEGRVYCVHASEECMKGKEGTFFLFACKGGMKVGFGLQLCSVAHALRCAVRQDVTSRSALLLA
eukprot:1162076-Pelagomonas_calceolata.AAC.1